MKEVNGVRNKWNLYRTMYNHLAKLLSIKGCLSIKEKNEIIQAIQTNDINSLKIIIGCKEEELNRKL